MCQQPTSHLPLLATATGLLGGCGLDTQWTFLPFWQLIQAQPGASSCFLLTTTDSYRQPRVPELHFLVSVQRFWGLRTIPKPTVSES